MKHLIAVALLVCLLSIGTPAFASPRVYLKGSYPTRCVRDLSKSHPYTQKRSYTVTRKFYVKNHVQYLTSHQDTYRLFRTSHRSFSANGIANHWAVHFTFDVTRWNRDAIGTKYKGTLTYRRTINGTNYLDYYHCVGTLNS